MSSQPKTATCPEEDPKANLDELFTRLYSRIHQLASRIRWNGANPTLNPTALVNEAYLKLQKSPPDLAAKSYDEVAAILANAMRQILVDAARRKGAQKRACGELPEPAELPVEDTIALESAFAELQLENPRQARVFECRYFLGMNCEEAASTLHLSMRTAERDWQQARAQVANRLRPAGV
jgi:RNA polymerase sigma factor (TIGR02999 family)